MRKSDFLDQLRLEVGLVYDYAVSKDDFFRKVLYRIYELVEKKCTITVYKPMGEGDFCKEFVIGKSREKKTPPFGLGFLHLCSSNISVLVKKKNDQVILSPIYGNGKLEYILVCNVNSSSYFFSEQDMQFVDELIRFIEAKNATFTNIEKEE